MTIGDVVLAEWAPDDDAFEPSPTWVDITATGAWRSATTSSGRPSTLDSVYEGADVSVMLQNHEALLDVDDWHRWKQVRLSDRDNGVFFHGYVETVNHDQALLPFDATAELACFDSMALLERASVTASYLATLTGMTAADAVAAIMSGTGLSVAATVGPSNSCVRFPTVAVGADRTSKALPVIQQILDTEAGLICQQPGDAPGALTLLGRYAPLIALAAGASAVFSEDPGPGEIQMQPPFPLSAPGATYRNDVICVGPSGVVKEAADVPAGEPPDTLSRTLLSQSDNWVQANADLWLNLYKSIAASPLSVTVQMYPHRLEDPAGGYRAAVLSLEHGDVVTVKATPVGATQRTWTCLVERITHTITSAGVWQATLGLSSAQPWLDAYGTYDDLLILDTDDYDSGKAWAP